MCQGRLLLKFLALNSNKRKPIKSASELQKAITPPNWLALHWINILTNCPVYECLGLNIGTLLKFWGRRRGVFNSEINQIMRAFPEIISVIDDSFWHQRLSDAGWRSVASALWRLHCESGGSGRLNPGCETQPQGLERTAANCVNQQAWRNPLNS